MIRALLLAVALAAMLAPATARAEDAPRLTVVELFTSQGCSSCPPADAYLGELAARPDILALSFHVEYWNYIGWTDPFAAKFATQRQRDYAKQLGMRYVYTPQMVVNGTTEGVGSERETIATLIKAAAADPEHVPLQVTRDVDGTLHVHVDGAAGTEGARLWLFGFDRMHTTDILRGENEGVQLRNYNVVRSCRDIGSWRGAPLDLTLPRDAAAGDGGIAVVLQLGSGHIIGAATLRASTS
jgi:hypothetical protein